MTDILGVDNLLKQASYQKPQASKQLSSQQGGESFMDVLSKTGDDILNHANNAESSINDFAMGKMSPEEIIVNTKEATLELEGGMAVIKSGVESVKQILNIQI
jgi:flagellar hook-basal body complex protein FliE